MTPAFAGIALAAALPMLLAFNQTPAATLYNQLLAIAGWGAALLLWARHTPGWRAGLKSPAASALALLLAAPMVSVVWRHLPASLGFSATAVIGTGLAVLLIAQGLPRELRSHAAEALCWGLLVAGLLNIVVSLVQVFIPGLADGDVIARSGIPGRAVSNLRQPNHLASLMMWAAVAAVFITEKRQWRQALPALLFACVFTVVLSASRTGFIGIGMLALWGIIDRKLSRGARLSLLATPLMLGVSWLLISLWSAESGHAFGAASRLSEGAGSPSRLAILRDAWALTLANPIFGVGWGEFNFAWSLSPFPTRPIAFFDHTHNLPSQLAVELGLPWAGAVLALLGWALWKAWRGALRDDEDTPLRRAALMIVLTIGLHSLLEYPLWYAYFLLPACFAFGLTLPADAPARPAGPALWEILGGLLITGCAFALWDYHRIVVIYAPAEDAAPLGQRIATGQHSVFFSHQADYAAATSQPPGPLALEAARRTAFNLIDARLLMHWSQSLEKTGDTQGARFLADRLREFRNPTGDNWFASCEDAASAPAMPQCQPASGVVDWRTLR
ncbi:O-antigen ligase [Pelomonas saccharophila]|uniref:O-antigen ligase n=1 Tax=Roseateles saccharophilus TaxID=304 RepID=A0ABU1YNZ4_ROSSA|nr:Wzy polymerase domain-containing protein [Roseateles saccharophilus]MDR7270574.1 O-antigen ligase [Roseateles saccharophilus]